MEWYWIVLIVCLSILFLIFIFSLFYKQFFKRVCDIICALAVFIFLWPLWIVLSILVRTKLGKPVIFKQVRPGKDGKLFTIYKFRTMSDKKDNNGNLLPDEKRLTKFGKLLRKTSLDEMPEAINILKGDMSVVGPRPFLVKDNIFFDKRINERQKVKPGLTGLSQIKGRNNLSWEQKFKFDLKYIDNISFFGDIAIVFKTIFKAFFKKENVNRNGFVTDIDYGDYLLSQDKISNEVYEAKIIESKNLLSKYNHRKKHEIIKMEVVKDYEQ